jgi:uncharacterized heparinase superfamily protein
MIAAGPFQRWARRIEFARHMPLAKMVRRARLTIRRRLPGRKNVAFTSTRGAAQVGRSSTLPQPVFAPRKHLAPVRVGGGWLFTFLNRSVEISDSPIDWSALGPGSADQLWRMNLHYMEYLEGVDDTAWNGLVSDWITSHPAYAPGDWRDSWNSYALSIRIVVWLQELARRAERLPSELVTRVEQSALDQTRFLLRNLETDLGGNHLIKNIKALIWASAYFAGDEPTRWRCEALRLLTSEIDRQVLPDGVHYERSPSYHAQVFADLLECRQALGSDAGGGKLDAALDRMAQAAADLVHPDGGAALFNDAGLTMAYSPAECVAVHERQRGRRPLARQRVFAYPDAGYYGLHGLGSFFLADCGRIAPDDLPAHGHGDVLSFEWSARGARIVVDQGVYEYIPGTRRQQARSAALHNTLCLEGADQADFFGAFRCGRRPNVQVHLWQAHCDGFVLEGSHDGYRHLPGRPRHVRRFEVSANGVRIDDRIEGATQRVAYIGFLLHPEVQVTPMGRQVRLVSGGAEVIMSSSHTITVEPAVWWPDIGVEWPTRRLVVRLSPGQPGATATLNLAGSRGSDLEDE